MFSVRYYVLTSPQNELGYGRKLDRANQEDVKNTFSTEILKEILENKNTFSILAGRCSGT